MIILLHQQIAAMIEGQLKESCESISQHSCEVKFNDNEKVVIEYYGIVKTVRITVEDITDIKDLERLRHADIQRAVKEYHIKRGCCDGTFTEPCPYKAK